VKLHKLKERRWVNEIHKKSERVGKVSVCYICRNSLRVRSRRFIKLKFYSSRLREEMEAFGISREKEMGLYEKTVVMRRWMDLKFEGTHAMNNLIPWLEMFSDIMYCNVNRMKWNILLYYLTLHSQLATPPCVFLLTLEAQSGLDIDKGVRVP